MSTKGVQQSASATGQPGRLYSVLGIAALCGALAFLTLLGVQDLQSPDLGYHLAYGNEFWDHGRIVDHNAFLYTLPATTTPPDRRPEPPPGGWYDSQGRYRFPNANWLTQVLLAGVWRLAGPVGLSAWRAAIIAGIGLLSVSTMRRLGVPWLWAAIGVLLIGLTAYERFQMRPELLSFLLLAAELRVLAGVVGGPRGTLALPARAPAGKTGQARLSAPPEAPALSWAHVAALTGLQVLLVNVHSYFLLGLLLTGAAMTDHLLRLAWRRLTIRRPDEADKADRTSALRLAAALGAQGLACLVNPWTWRLAVMPIQTLRYLDRHDIIAGAKANGLPGHPWECIGEFYRPLAAGANMEAKAIYAFYVLLALVGVAGLAALARRRWGSALILAAMTGVGLTMRRNIALGAILAAPVALAAIQPAAGRLAARLGPAGRRVAAVAATAVLLAACAALGRSVVTQQFFYGERSAARFGVGLNRLQLPLGAGQWIKDHRPVGRLWADYNCSSGAYFFSGCQYPVNIVTNTWACPPSVMTEAIRCALGLADFEALARKQDVQAVVLRTDAAPGLVSQLARNASVWKLVCVDGIFVVFLRADGPNAALAASCELSGDTFDVQAYRRRLERYDALPQQGLNAGAMTFYQIGWYSQAIALFSASVNEHGDKYPSTWDLLGQCHLERARRKAEARDPTCKDDWEQAGQWFSKILQIDPADEVARNHLNTVKADWDNYLARTGRR